MCPSVAGLPLACAARPGSWCCGAGLVADHASPSRKDCVRDVEFISDVSVPIAYGVPVISVCRELLQTLNLLPSQCLC